VRKRNPLNRGTWRGGLRFRTALARCAETNRPTGRNALLGFIMLFFAKFLWHLPMPNYRRALAAGGCWFFTVNLLDRRNATLTDNVEALRDAVRVVRDRYPFHIDAMVVLPEHIHAVWTLPADDADFSLRWRLIKTRFAHALPILERIDAVRQARGERGIWQRRFWEHWIRHDSDYARHVAYCYINPVKHGLANRVCGWPHSSFHRDVRAGIFPKDWAGTVETSGAFGERSP
jgi:putative transposase